MDQSHAVLSAVLLPPMRAYGTLKLATPEVRSWKQSDPAFICRDDKLQHDWMYQDHYLDKLLTLSCYTRGIRPILLSVFYEPTIECNALTPWLQGELAAVDSVPVTIHIFRAACSDRAPEAACLWLGCTVLGLNRKLLREA